MDVSILVCLLALAATGYASNCARTSDCHIVDCNDGFYLKCYDHVCTCFTSYRGFNCTLPAQCDHAFGSCTHGDHHWHCLDNRCMCRSLN